MLSGHWNSASRVIADATASDIFYSFRGFRSIPMGRRQLSIVHPGPPVRVFYRTRERGGRERLSLQLLHSFTIQCGKNIEILKYGTEPVDVKNEVVVQICFIISKPTLDVNKKQ